MRHTLLLVFVTLTFGCTSNTKSDSAPEKAEQIEKTTSLKTDELLPFGVRRAVSAKDFETTYALVRSTLADDPNAVILAEIDHQKNASSKGLKLEPTRVILYNSPTQTLPFLAANPLTGLDLPQRILVYERENITYVMTNRLSYLGNRFEISKVMDTAFDIAKFGPEDKSESAVVGNQGLKIVQSKKSFDDTYAALKQLLTKNENLNIMAEHDFASSGEEKNPERQAKLIIFGNPNLGTPMMKKSRSIALDLPQKMLVYSVKNTVQIAYNDPQYLALRHNFTLPEVTKKISGALGKLSSKAAE